VLLVAAVLFAIWTTCSGFRPHAPLFGERLWTIPSNSMTPTIRSGQKVWAAPAKPAAVKPGQLVIAKVLVSGDASKPKFGEIVGRVVVLGPALVTAKRGQVTVDGVPLAEPYLPDTATTTDFVPIEVPAGQALLMGDNRIESSDGRFLGPTPLPDVRYRIRKVFTPLIG
jgi:signal peptidase I